MKTTISRLGKIASISILLSCQPIFQTCAHAKDESKAWQKELKQDLVKIVEGKLTITEYAVCREQDSSVQIRTYSEAPKGVVSRDNFVAFTVLYAASMLQTIGNLECHDIDAPIGNVDVDILIYMTEQGIRLETRDSRTNLKNSETLLWSDVFSDE